MLALWSEALVDIVFDPNTNKEYPCHEFTALQMAEGRAMKMNKIRQLHLMGGLIGSMLTNPIIALNHCIYEENQQGWNAVYFSAHRDTNLLINFLKILVLILTMGLWTWGAGYLILFERERVE